VSDRAGAPPPGSLVRRFGAPAEAGVPKIEIVHVTKPDLTRRVAMEKTRGRLVLAAFGFLVLFGAVSLKLADATIIRPLHPRVAVRGPSVATGPVVQVDAGAPGGLAGAAGGLVDVPRADLPSVQAERATITDRNGQILALSLPTAGLYANPRVLTDAADAAHKLKSVLPELDEADVRARLSDTRKQFVYIARQITPRQELAINDFGIPGIQFQPTARRRYPQGNVAAQVLGGVDVDGHGVAGVERAFDQRLAGNGAPLRLSLDVRVQAVMRDELAKSMAEFKAIGACGIVMDVNTGEVLAMVSLPDYNANEFGTAKPDDRFNRAVTGMYEPGSTFKLQTVSMALDDGVVQTWNGFDATSPIHIGRFAINDFEGKHRFLYVPEIIAYSSNIGAAKMAQAVGMERQRAWLQKLNLMSRLKVQLPEAGRPLFPAINNWGEAATLTIGFGHGVAVSPLHVVTATAAVADGGILHQPTLLADDDVESGGTAVADPGVRIMQASTSDITRKLMRLVVTAGYGKPAEVPGYYVGGKTGTAEKVVGRGYARHANVSAFVSVFPMNAPRYAVYFMLDDPQGNKSTGGFSTAGAVSAPGAGRVIARIAPMLGLLPDLQDAPQIDATLAIPMQPPRPAGAHGPLTPPAWVPPRPEVAEGTDPVAGRRLPVVDRGHPPLAPLLPRPRRDIRHEAMWLPPGGRTE
jgi:cell division protein FtsI (penicillin-binding protein 3)